MSQAALKEEFGVFSNPFDTVVEAAPDPLFGVKQQYLADPRPNKVDLSVGVYYAESGRLEKMAAALKAETLLHEKLAAGKLVDYLGMPGTESFSTRVKELLIHGSSWVDPEAVVTVQSLGGTGALRLAADFLSRHLNTKTILVSAPTWPVHTSLFERAGFKISQYPYYDLNSHRLLPSEMQACLRAAAPQTVVLMHAVCHNPSGLDLDLQGWTEVAQICEERGLVPLLDMAYQGLGLGLEADLESIKAFSRRGLPFLVAQSFSKNFSMYNRRVGALHLFCRSAKHASTVLSQLKTDIRNNYSNPPMDGAAIVDLILSTPELRALWMKELNEMRLRLDRNRNQLAAKLADAGHQERFAHFSKTHGMFVMTGLSGVQVTRLKDNDGMYVVGNGRLCLSALNLQNIDAVASAISKVLA